MQPKMLGGVLGVAEDCCMLSILPPRGFLYQQSFGHGVFPTSYFTYSYTWQFLGWCYPYILPYEFYTCFTHFPSHKLTLDRSSGGRCICAVHADRSTGPGPQRANEAGYNKMTPCTKEHFIGIIIIQWSSKLYIHVFFSLGHQRPPK